MVNGYPFPDHHGNGSRGPAPVSDSKAEDNQTSTPSSEATLSSAAQPIEERIHKDEEKITVMLFAMFVHPTGYGQLAAGGG